MTAKAADTRHWRNWWLYVSLLALLAALIAGGYLLFRTFAVEVMPSLSAYNLLVLAIIAGVASFFSPCVFPLLPGYLSVYYAVGDQAPKRDPFALGVAAALGVVTFNLGLGVVIGLLGAGVAEGVSISSADPSAFVRLFRGGVGLALVALGVMQLAGTNIKPQLVDSFAWRMRPQREGTTRDPAFSLYLYGLGYNAAGMGCTGPILAGLVVFTLSAGGFAAALSAFAVFSITMAGLMLVVSALAATSQEALVHRLKATAPRIKRASSVLLIGAGLFNVLSALVVEEFVRLLFP
jgi:cytochrome c-type biogenesis protein